MTYKQLQDAVISMRFNENDRDKVKLWINQSYRKIWDAADWPFKTTSTDLTVAAGDNSPAMPADFRKVITLSNSDGERLIWLPQQDWEETYLYPSAGAAEAYTVIDGQIYLGPQQSTAETLSLSYKRRVSHVDPVSGIIGGVMVEDGDQPIWPAEHDYLLVIETVMLGQQLNNDPTWVDLKPARDEALAAMKQDLATGEAHRPLRFWGS